MSKIPFKKLDIAQLELGGTKEIYYFMMLSIHFIGGDMVLDGGIRVTGLNILLMSLSSLIIAL